MASFAKPNSRPPILSNGSKQDQAPPILLHKHFPLSANYRPTKVYRYYAGFVLPILVLRKSPQNIGKLRTVIGK